MTKNTLKTWGGQTYETPSVEVLDVVSEGVFCASFATDTDESSIEDWEYDQDFLEF